MNRLQIAALLWIGSHVLYFTVLVLMVKRGSFTISRGRLIGVVVFYPAMVYTLSFAEEGGMPVWQALLLWPICAVAAFQRPARKVRRPPDKKH